MQSIKSILVVIDPTVKRDFVVERARLIAKATAAKVTLFVNNANSLNQQSYQYEGIDPEFFIKQRKLFIDHHKHMLEALAAEFAKDKIQTSTIFEEKNNLAEAIIVQAEQMQANLVVKSTHHHNLAQRLLITNTDWRLIRKCPSPLLLVKPREWQAKGKIVTGVDPMHPKAEQSRLDHELLETTQFLAAALQQEPLVFHSYFPFVSNLFTEGLQTEAVMGRIREQHIEKLNKLLASHKIDANNIHLSCGELVPKLNEFLHETAANLLVIGALSRNKLERAVVGETAEKILEDCSCDVMVVKLNRHK